MKQHYALTNPISMILDKPVEDFTRADLVRVIEEKNIERITFHYTALDGKLKELKLPVVSREQAERVLADGERVDGSSLFKGMVDASVSDLYVVPLYKTAFLNPFESGSLDLVCRYLTAEGERAPFALDNILHNAARLFTDTTGLEFYAMGELEFFLIGDQQAQIFPGDRQRGYHASAPFVKSGRVLDEMVRAIAQMTGAVKYAHSEVGRVEQVRSDLEEIRGKRAEQLEIEFLPTPVEEAGSHLVLARWLIRNIAFKYGYVATFAPKIEEGVAGNGFHVHMALMKDGKNVMTGEGGALTDPARQVIGGLCKYADSLTAFGNTVSSAYLRLVPNQEAPTRICWSDLNRSAMIRVPLGWAGTSNLARMLNPQQVEELEESRESRQTVELRSPDGSAIIHLLLAGITMAAQWGLTRPESLKTAEELYAHGNIFKNQELLDRLPALPTSCVASARRLAENRGLYEREGIFPPGVIDYMVKLLQSEKDEHMNEHLVDLPADDRLHETRRIMHAVLHRH
jgi:glutamine synthetase